MILWILAIGIIVLPDQFAPLVGIIGAWAAVGVVAIFVRSGLELVSPS